MKEITNKLKAVIAIAAVLFIAACSPSDETEHQHQDGETHDHEHGSMAPADDTSGEQVSADDDASGSQVAAKSYPLETCLVSGEKLGSMGEPHRIVFEGQEVKFCCKECVDDFEAESDSFLAKIEEAE